MKTKFTNNGLTKVKVIARNHGHNFKINEVVSVVAVLLDIGNPEYTCKECGNKIFYSCSDGEKRAYLLGECEMEAI